MMDGHRVTGVTSVGLCPAVNRVLGESLDTLGAVATVRPPRGDVVGEMSSVAVVVQRELLDSLVADLHVLQFVCEVPLAVAPLAGHRRYVVDVVRIGRPARAVVGSVWHVPPYLAERIGSGGRSVTTNPAEGPGWISRFQPSITDK